MVSITNGVDTFEVTKGAFETVFKHQGYKLLSDVQTAPQNALEPVQKTEDELFAEEISKKPITEWSQEEMKRFADIKGISLDGVEKVGQAREIIASYLG